MYNVNNVECSNNVKCKHRQQMQIDIKQQMTLLYLAPMFTRAVKLKSLNLNLVALKIFEGFGILTAGGDTQMTL